MRRKTINLTILVMVVLAALSNPGGQSSSGQQLPATNRKVPCGCYCGGSTPAYFLFGEKDCAGILAADACGNNFSSLPETDRKRICTALKAKGKPRASCPMAKALLDSCDLPHDKCEKPAPWFDTSSSSGCKDVQDTQVTIDQKTATATVSMCGFEILKHASENLAAAVVPIFSSAYAAAFKEKIPKRVCCDKFREAARTGVPCDPKADVDCDGTPNQTDVHGNPPSPSIEVFTTSAGASIDRFPINFNVTDPDFLPDSTARDSKGVGDCGCKWQLIKGEMNCNGVMDKDGKKHHVYIATWRCPSTKAEVVTTKYAPSTAPCP